MRAAIYCRISSDKTGEQAGVTRQLEDCRKLASAIGWVVVEEYIDNDISASSGKVRPRYRDMLQAVEARDVDAIVCWAPDRLYRKARDLEPLIDVMEKAGAAIRTCRAGDIDLSTPNGRMIARITGAVATMEGEQKAERWTRSIRQRREQGQAPGWGHRLFGYARTGDIIQPEADAIRWAAGELIDGASIASVATALSDQGHTSTRGNPWTRNALKKLLTNPRLAGHSTLNGDIIGVGTWQPILIPQVFEQLQSALMIHRGTQTRRPRIGLLVGLLHCGKPLEDGTVCGAPLMSGRNNSTRQGQTERPRVYRCKKMPGRPGCGGIVIAADPLERMVEEFAKEQLDDPWVRERLQGLADTTGQNTAEIIALEERLLEQERELDTPGPSIDAIRRAMDRTRERIETLQRAAVIVPSATALKGDWPQDLARRARMVRLVVSDVIVEPALVRGRRAFEPERIKIVTR